MAGAAPHVMVLPFPAQGHVTPLMELSHRLVDHGLRVTFVCTEPIRKLLLDALADDKKALDGIRLVSVPDGLADGDSHRDLGKVLAGVLGRVPGYVEELIRETEASGENKVQWLVADATMACCFQVARNLGVRVASVCPSSAACLVTSLRIPQLIHDGFFDDKGFPKRHGTFELAPGMPPLRPTQMTWNIDGALEGRRAAFELAFGIAQVTDLAEIVMCKSFHEAETGAFELCPDIMPIGPLFADQELRKPVGQFWPEDASCLEWLDAQPEGSVVSRRTRREGGGAAMAKGHVLVLPMPCQGHVVPLMELSHRLVDHGFEVTFVNTEIYDNWEEADSLRGLEYFCSMYGPTICAFYMLSDSRKMD
uniref:Putative UDP-glucosyltransferase n=1 Tax=Aegilops tauschii TaxID=37682 RepID=N1QPV7_AEGTA